MNLPNTGNLTQALLSGTSRNQLEVNFSRVSFDLSACQLLQQVKQLNLPVSSTVTTSSFTLHRCMCVMFAQVLKRGAPKQREQREGKDRRYDSSVK